MIHSKTMALSKEKLQKEIATIKKAIADIKETEKKCGEGILINEIVLRAFEEELK